MERRKLLKLLFGLPLGVWLGRVRIGSAGDIAREAHGKVGQDGITPKVNGGISALSSHHSRLFHRTETSPPSTIRSGCAL